MRIGLRRLADEDGWMRVGGWVKMDGWVNKG